MQTQTQTFQEVHDELVAIQGNKCAICGRPEIFVNPLSGKVHRLCLDHDHNTGDVRGLLCRRCNTMVGKINDDISILARAIDYIQSAAKRLQEQTGKRFKVAGITVAAEFATVRRTRSVRTHRA